MLAFFHIRLVPFPRHPLLYPREALTEVQTPRNIYVVVLSKGKPRMLNDHIACWAQIKTVSVPNSF